MIPNASPFQRGDKVVAYCRYSEGDEQGLKNQSTEEQAEAIRRFCAQNGLELVRIFADPFASGRSVAKRDHYLEMLSYLLKGKKRVNGIAGLVVWDWERYGRNFDQAQLDAARLRMHGYKMFSLQQPIVDEGPFARVLEAMYFASAQNQSDMISADVKRALQSNFQKYKVIPRSCIPDGWIAVPVQMGYLSDGTERIGYRAEPDPDLIEPIRQAVAARIAGSPVSEIKHIIGGPFANRPEKVEKLMTKPLLYGSMAYGGTTIEDYCTPIIDRETFDRLQIANKAGKAKIRKPGSGAWSKDRAMLSGLLRCGVCGENVYINRRKSNGKIYETYYCNHKHSNFRKALLDGVIIDAAIDLLTGEKYEKAKTKLITAMQRSETEEPEDREAILTEIMKLDKKLDNLTDAIADAPHSAALLLKLAELEAKRDNLAAKLTKPAETRYDALDSILDNMRDNTLRVLKDEKSGTEDLRTALSMFISAIDLYPNGEVVLHHTVPGLSYFESEFGGLPTAPPEEDLIYSQTIIQVCL